MRNSAVFPTTYCVMRNTVQYSPPLTVWWGIQCNIPPNLLNDGEFSTELNKIISPQLIISSRHSNRVEFSKVAAVSLAHSGTRGPTQQLHSYRKTILEQLATVSGALRELRSSTWNADWLHPNLQPKIYACWRIACVPMKGRCVPSTAMRADELHACCCDG